MYPVVKRCIDIVGAGLGLIMLSPLLAVVGVAVWMQMGRPIRFRQMRPRLNGRPFYMYNLLEFRHEIVHRNQFKVSHDEEKMTIAYQKKETGEERKLDITGLPLAIL